jgi:hypothetical protein
MHFNYFARSKWENIRDAKCKINVLRGSLYDRFHVYIFRGRRDMQFPQPKHCTGNRKGKGMPKTLFTL